MLEHVPLCFPLGNENSGNARSQRRSWNGNTKADLGPESRNPSAPSAGRTFQTRAPGAREHGLVASLSTTAEKESQSRKRWCVGTGSGSQKQKLASTSLRREGETDRQTDRDREGRKGERNGKRQREREAETGRENEFTARTRGCLKPGADLRRPSSREWGSDSPSLSPHPAPSRVTLHVCVILPFPLNQLSLPFI